MVEGSAGTGKGVSNCLELTPFASHKHLCWERQQLASRGTGRGPQVDQFTPQVTQEDVERVLQRDFPIECWQELREMIQRVQVREKDRVILACMKNAGGDVHKLKGNLNEAAGYYREIIGEAEYPFYSKKMFRIDKLTEREKADIIEKDKQQYLDWLNRNASCS